MVVRLSDLSTDTTRSAGISSTRRLTSTQPSRSSRPGSPWSSSRLCGGVSLCVLCFPGFEPCAAAAGRPTQVSGSSRQDLPAARRLTRTPLVFLSPAEAVISVRSLFVTSPLSSRSCPFSLSVCLSFRPSCVNGAYVSSSAAAALTERSSAWRGRCCLQEPPEITRTFPSGRKLD